MRNTGAAIADLMDTRATTFDDDEPHPDGRKVTDLLAGLPWVQAVATRVRDQGQFFHVEAFVVPDPARPPSVEELRRARQQCQDLDWKLLDVVVVPVPELPDHL